MKAKGSPTASTQEAQQNPAANQQPAEEASSWSSAPAASGVTLSSVFAYSVAASVADEQMNAGLLRAEARWEAVWAEDGSEEGGGNLEQRRKLGGVTGSLCITCSHIGLEYLTSHSDSFVAQ